MSYQRQVFSRYLSVNEERQLLRHIDKFKDPLAQRDHAWIRLARHSGARIETLCKFTCHDAREALRTGSITFRAAILKGRKASGQDHHIHATTETRKALEDLLRLRRLMGFVEQPDEALIMSRNHRGISPRMLQKRLKAWAISAGLSERISPHWLRHTLAKRIMAQSTAANPLLIAMQALGHANLDTTAIYLLPDKEQMAQHLQEASR